MRLPVCPFLSSRQAPGAAGSGTPTPSWRTAAAHLTAARGDAACAAAGAGGSFAVVVNAGGDWERRLCALVERTGGQDV